jgi:hypothetical protein
MKPYGYVRKDGEGLFIYGEHQFQNAMDAELVPVYLHPKEWVGLTDEEIEGAIDDGFAFGLNDGNVSNQYVIRYVRVIEAKLKEKNT